MAVHSLVKYEYQPYSFPEYRHYVECTCGFQSRLSTKEAAQSQFNSHLAAHNTKLHEFPVETTNVGVTSETGGWAPFSKKSSIKPHTPVAPWKPAFGK